MQSRRPWYATNDSKARCCREARNNRYVEENRRSTPGPKTYSFRVGFAAGRRPTEIGVAAIRFAWCPRCSNLENIFLEAFSSVTTTSGGNQPPHHPPPLPPPPPQARRLRISTPPSRSPIHHIRGLNRTLVRYGFSASRACNLPPHPGDLDRRAAESNSPVVVVRAKSGDLHLGVQAHLCFDEGRKEATTERNIVSELGACSRTVHRRRRN